MAGDIPVTGDWTGDGNAKVGIFRSSTGQWFLDKDNSGTYDAQLDYTYTFGQPGDIPVVGDWNGVQGVSTHKDCIGVFRNGFFWVLDLNCNGTFDDGSDGRGFPVRRSRPVTFPWSASGTAEPPGSALSVHM